MTSQGWLSLNEYSVKYGISLSTLRRRIRGNEVQTKFEDGKYFLPDKAIAKHIKAIPAEFNKPEIQKPTPAAPVAESPEKGELLSELKSAYVSVLQEKEQQILQLREEIGDLKTLVEILENENERLKSNLRESAPIDSWLDKTLDR